MIEYRVVDCRPDVRDGTGTTVRAATPEAAALMVLDEKLGRGGQAPNLRARVYSQLEGQPLTMVRLYSRSGRQRGGAASDRA